MAVSTVLIWTLTRWISDRSPGALHERLAMIW